MDPNAPGPQEPPPRTLTGAANLVRALRNLGLLGHSHGMRSGTVHFTADDGQAIPVRVLGHGEPVVLVHGLGCSHEHWMPVARRLARHRQVLAWDARGHGRCETRPGTSITLPRLARDLHLLLEHFALERAALVGHSMGALTVLRYLHDHGPARVAAVALVDQSPRIVTDEHWRLGLFGGCSAATLEALIRGARTDLAQTVIAQIEARAGAWLRPALAAHAPLGRALRRWLKGVDAAPLLDLAESLAQADFRGVLARLELPLLVVLGGRSPHYGGVPLEQYYRDTVPHARVRVYARAGHSPHYTEPARFVEELLHMTQAPASRHAG